MGALEARSEGKAQSEGASGARSEGKAQSEGASGARSEGKAQSEGVSGARSEGKAQSEGASGARSEGKAQSEGASGGPKAKQKVRVVRTLPLTAENLRLSYSSSVLFGHTTSSFFSSNLTQLKDDYFFPGYFS